MRTRLIVLRFKKWLKSSIITFFKPDVPTYVFADLATRLLGGEKEIVLPMCKDANHKSLVDYFNEYHNEKKCWNLSLLNFCFYFVKEKVVKKLSKLIDVNVEILDISDTDKRIVIKLIEQ